MSILVKGDENPDNVLYVSQNDSKIYSFLDDM